MKPGTNGEVGLTRTLRQGAPRLFMVCTGEIRKVTYMKRRHSIRDVAWQEETRGHLGAVSVATV